MNPNDARAVHRGPHGNRDISADALADRALLADPSKDYTAVALANWRMLDEVEALGVSVLDGDMLSIRLLPSGRESEAIRL